MNYQYVDKNGKHRYDNLLDARVAAEKACVDLKESIVLCESVTGRPKCIFTYDEENKIAKLSLPKR